MNRQWLKRYFGMGLGLWLVGYILGIILFAVVPVSMVGWVIMPVGVLITLWVLIKKVGAETFRYYVRLAVVWVLMAVILDYVFLVLVFKPADGYYKLDVYLYYLLTAILPLAVGWQKSLKRQK